MIIIPKIIDARPIKTVYFLPILFDNVPNKANVMIDDTVKIIVNVPARPVSFRIFWQYKLLNVSIALKLINQNKIAISNIVLIHMHYENAMSELLRKIDPG